jgi:hypothetical protein
LGKKVTLPHLLSHTSVLVNDTETEEFKSSKEGRRFFELPHSSCESIQLISQKPLQFSLVIPVMCSKYQSILASLKATIPSPALREESALELLSKNYPPQRGFERLFNLVDDLF